MLSTGQPTELENYDVFLCHNSKDKSEIRSIADDLIQSGIKPWLDERDIVPGSSWKSAIEDQVSKIKSAAIFIGDNDLGRYQQKEIQDLIDEHDKRPFPVIPVFLASSTVTPVLPILLKEFHAVDFRKMDPDPIQQLIWGIKGEKQTSSTSPISPELTNLRSLRRIPEPLSQELRSGLFYLLNVIKDYWIEGILKSSLENQTPLYLEKLVVNEKVEGGSFNGLSTLTVDNKRIKKFTPIETILDVSRHLLILGAPGSGKTTTLLELAQHLARRAQTNPDEECVPIIVNLSSWQRGQEFSKWIINTLSKTHNLPREEKNLRDWLDKGYLIPLLDGLDEVKKEYQADCVDAINDFITKSENKLPGIIVSCRLKDYQWLPHRLKLYGAIQIEPLDQSQISQYIRSLGANYQTLHKTLADDADLQKLAESPFMLNIMSKASLSANLIKKGEQSQPLETRKKQIIEAYVNKVFQHKETIGKLFPQNYVIYWLSWLAKTMGENSQTAFWIENLQPQLITLWQQKTFYRMISAIIFGLLIGLMGLLIIQVTVLLNQASNTSSTYGLVIALTLGLMANTDKRVLSAVICFAFFSVMGVLLGWQANVSSWVFDGIYLLALIIWGVGALNSINTVEKLSWSWEVFVHKFLTAFGIGLIIGLLIGLYHAQTEPLNGLIEGLTFGLLFGLILGLMSGLIGGFTDRLRKSKPKPNQGIKLTFSYSVIVFFRSMSVFGLILGSVYWFFAPSLNAILIALILSLQFSLVIALNHGLAAVIKHYSLRLTLWRYSYLPLDLVAFLDYCAKLILLKKAGGSYLFIHRMLQDYFAELDTSKFNLSKTPLTKKNEPRH